MNLATMIAALVISHIRLEPVITIRIAAIGIAGSVIICLLTPIGFSLLGASAGGVIISQTAFLAETGAPQGAMMGLYNTATYGGLFCFHFSQALSLNSHPSP